MPVQTFGNTSDNLSLPNVRPTLDLNFAKTKVLDPRISFSRSTIGTYVGADGLIKTAGVNEPRFDHDPATGQSLGLLIEESRTNLLTYSTDFTQSSWNRSNIIIAPNAAIAPDGTFTGSKMSVTGAAGSFKFLSQGTATNNTISAFVKKGEYIYGSIGKTNGSGYWTSVNFNLNTGTYINTTSESISELPTGYGIIPYGNGWYKIWVSFSTANFGNSPFIAGTIDGEPIYGATRNNAGDGTSGIYIWGAQLEAGSFPTSYIPTPATFTGRTGTATYYDANGTIQTAADGVARSNAYFPDSNGIMRPAGLLLESASTNLLQYSEQFDNIYWPKSVGGNASTISANSAVSPDGNTTADKIVTTTNNGLHGIQKTGITLINGTTYTVSVFAKSAGWTRVGIRAGVSSADFRCTVNLSDGSILQNTGVASVQKLPNGWYKVSITGVSSGTSGEVTIEAHNTKLTQENELGDGTSGIFIWGAQLEASPYPTSYIPTTNSTVTRSADVSSSSTVTRSADVAQITGTNFSSWWNASSGSFLFSHKSPTTPSNSTYFYLVTAGGASTLNGYRITSLVIPADGSGSNAWSTIGAWLTTGLAANEPARLAFGFTNGSAATVKNGVVQETNTEALAAVYPTALSIASNVTSTISRLTYWPTRLSNDQLRLLTQ